MRAATSGVEFFAGSHEAGTHSSGIGLAAGSHADTKTRGRGQASVVFYEGKVRLGLPGVIVGAETKVFVRLVRIDELARVHSVGGVEDAFEVAEGNHQLFAEHLRKQRAASLTVAVFA